MQIRLIASVIVLVAFGAGAAQARIRDDVMAGAFRCGVIGDGRQWLDCYYGAAQPLRTQLALPPALKAQVTLAMAPPTGSVMQVDEAHARDTVISAAFGCTAIEDDRQWLDCYYAAAQAMRAQLKLSPAPQERLRATATSSITSGARVTTAVPGLTPRDDEFGNEIAPSQVLPALDHIVSRMAAFKFDRYGIFTLTLANGQVWQQLEGDTAFAKLKPPASNYVVTIQRGFFGSYNLTIKGVPGLFRVHRGA